MTLVINALETHYNPVKLPRLEIAACVAVGPPAEDRPGRGQADECCWLSAKACPGISNVPGDGYPTHSPSLATTTTGIGSEKVF